MRNHTTTLFLSSLLLAASAFLTGCGSRAADSCNAAIECGGGNDADINACIAATDGLANEAAAYDCADAFDKVLDCIEKTGTCKSGSYHSDCGDEADALGKCEKAASARK
ncbi:MAG: hypothetical protein ABI193_11315 [Minicystis sp.]